LLKKRQLVNASGDGGLLLLGVETLVTTTEFGGWLGRKSQGKERLDTGCCHGRKGCRWESGGVGCLGLFSVRCGELVAFIFFGFAVDLPTLELSRKLPSFLFFGSAILLPFAEKKPAKL
jgi:hypothetical protein